MEGREMLPLDDNGDILSGELRAGENPGLASLHTLFVREHNRVARELAKIKPKLMEDGGETVQYCAKGSDDVINA